MAGTLRPVHLSPVFAVIGVSSEVISAHSTLIRPLARVKSLVILEHSPLGKPLATEAALLLLQPGAGLHVLCQVVGCPEELETYLALKPLLFLVRQHVLVQTPFSPPLKLLAADLTCEEGGPVCHPLVDFVVLLMPLPAELTLEFSVAAIAFKGHFS